MKVFTIFGPAGHLGHDLDYLYILFTVLRRLNFKFGFVWFIEKDLENGGHMHVFNPSVGADNYPGSNVYINTFIQSFVASFPPINDFVTVFPIQMYTRPYLTLL